jgi:hypothetical protein
MLEKVQTPSRWQIVVLVTCCEAYIQDALSAAAAVDTSLMARSEQSVAYDELVAAASVEELAHEMRARWARAWLRDGGPQRWLQRLEKMGARGYAADLGQSLERVLGMRHVIVHAGGKADTDFVRRHPGVVARAGDYLLIGGGMRFLLKVCIPVESGNAAAKAGKLGATIQSILAELKPEAVYFADDKANAQATPSSKWRMLLRFRGSWNRGCSPSMPVSSFTP